MKNLYLNKDCMLDLINFKENEFDIGVVDPNWGIGESLKNHNSRNTPVKQKNGNSLNIKNKNYHQSDWDITRPSKEYFKELLRVCKYVIIWGGNHFTDLIPEHSSGRIIWDKCNASNDFSDCEIAWTNLFSSTRIIRYMWSGMMQGKSISEGHIQQGNKKLNEKRIHPTQKPVVLYKWIANEFFKTGWKIIDTHTGSASSLIAYEDYGFKYVAYENNLKHFHDSNTRLNNFKAQCKMKFKRVS